MSGILCFKFFQLYPTDETTIACTRVPSINSTDTIPTWVKGLYEKETEQFLNDAIPTVIFFKKLSDRNNLLKIIKLKIL